MQQAAAQSVTYRCVNTHLNTADEDGFTEANILNLVEQLLHTTHIPPIELLFQAYEGDFEVLHGPSLWPISSRTRRICQKLTPIE